MKILLTLLTLSTAIFAQTWDLDAGHGEARFKIRHMMVSNVTGTIGGFKGTCSTDDKDEAKLTGCDLTIDANTINTNNEKRDAHLKNEDFFDTAKHPTIAFKSKKAVKKGSNWELTGDLTMHGVTKEVTFKNVELTKSLKDLGGATRRGLSANITINRKDFGITWNKAMDSGGVALGETVDVTVEAEMTLPKKDGKS